MDRRLKKCVRRVDRISCLPEHVILHILSFLPLKEAAASTSLVSKRWSNLCKHIPNINLTFKHHNPNYINWVNSALELHKALSLQEFRVDFRVQRQNHHHVAKWLEHAFSRRVERLHLDLNGVGAAYDYDDCAVLDQEMLKEVVGISRSYSFKSLKVLCLRSFQVCGDALGFLVHSCVSLEKLVIYRARRISNLEIVAPSLKHLDMRSRSLDVKCIDVNDPYCREDYSVKVVAPNLTCLTIDQNSNIVFLEHVPKLVNLHFFLRFEVADTMHHFANIATQLVTLVIHLFGPDPQVTFSVPEMPKLKKLVVFYRLNHMAAILPMTHFLCASPCLEEFKLDVSELYCRNVAVPFGVGPPCPHRHLKLFVLSGFCEVAVNSDLGTSRLAGGLDLVRYMVDNCVALEEIVVGQCNLVGLVRDIIVDSYDPLDDVIVEPGYLPRTDVATPQEQEDFRNVMQLQQIPPHIKLRIVFEDANAPYFG